MDIALVAFGLVLAILSTIIGPGDPVNNNPAPLRIVVVVIAAALFVAAGLNALGVFH